MSTFRKLSELIKVHDICEPFMEHLMNLKVQVTFEKNGWEHCERVQ